LPDVPEVDRLGPVGDDGSRRKHRLDRGGAYRGSAVIKLGRAGLVPGMRVASVVQFDDANGLTMTNEIYIDRKPDSYAFAGKGRQVLTRAQCVEKFPLLASE
jgi:hypothetical protein